MYRVLFVLTKMLGEVHKYKLRVWSTNIYSDHHFPTVGVNRGETAHFHTNKVNRNNSDLEMFIALSEDHN